MTTMGVPKGCSRCAKCQEYRGFYAKKEQHAMGNLNGRSGACTIYCSCANQNKCARCGQPLAERKLRAHYYDEDNHRIPYMSGLHALGHRCTEVDAPPAMTAVEVQVEYEREKRRMGWR